MIQLHGNIDICIADLVATITFGHPAANSFPSVLLDQLVKTIQTADADPNVAVLILKSEGQNVFCSGASFDELLQVSNQDEAQAFFMGFANLINAMRKCSKPIVGCVQGKVVGGGLGIVAACDYVLASDKAAIKLSELSIGIGPFVIAPAIERKTNKATLNDLALSPTEWKNAQWAKEQGLYNVVFQEHETLQQQTQQYALQLAGYSKEALAALKQMLWEGTSHWDILLKERASTSGRLVLSQATKQALQQFKK